MSRNIGKGIKTSPRKARVKQSKDNIKKLKRPPFKFLDGMHAGVFSMFDKMGHSFNPRWSKNVKGDNARKEWNELNDKFNKREKTILTKYGSRISVFAAINPITDNITKTLYDTFLPVAEMMVEWSKYLKCVQNNARAIKMTRLNDSDVVYNSMDKDLQKLNVLWTAGCGGGTMDLFKLTTQFSPQWRIEIASDSIELNENVTYETIRDDMFGLADDPYYGQTQGSEMLKQAFVATKVAQRLLFYRCRSEPLP